MKTTANIATYPPRKESLKKMLKSIEGQFDFIRICANGYTSEEAAELSQSLGARGTVFVPETDRTDNGKFVYLDVIEDDEYYFTLDDDLEYPSDYVEKTKSFIDEFGCIVTYHGRALIGKGLSYYKGHYQYHCLNEQSESLQIDVMGSGVSAFSTKYFKPLDIAHDQRMKMSDLLVSLEAAKQKKTIGLMPHSKGWLKLIENNETIYETETKKGTPIQNEIANEIYSLRHEDN